VNQRFVESDLPMDRRGLGGVLGAAIGRYFLPFPGFPGLSGSFLGLPRPGTLRIASKTSLAYMASLVSGLKPALCIRLSTVLGGSPKILDISVNVIPFIPLFIGILKEKLKNVYKIRHLLYNRIAKFRKK
jgi:hypothetical protein